MEVAGIPPALSDAVESIKEAITAGRTDIFRKLIETCETCDGGGLEERKQLINSISNNDGTFLHMATKLGRKDIVRALLASDADPGILDKNGNSPIQLSPSAGVTAIFVDELLRATSQSEVGRVCQLVASGLSVNSVDNSLSKNTPLHWAASFADLDTVNCLIARGADVNSCNNTGSTPLHDAIYRGDSSIIETLLENGADPHIVCIKGAYKGKSCFDLAKSNHEILSILEKYPSNGIQNGRGTHMNGSISPILCRKSVAEIGSLDSLVSSADSVITNGVGDPIVNYPAWKKTVRATSLSSVDEETLSVAADRKVNGEVKSSLQSSCSLDLNPLIEQVCERLSVQQLTTPPRPLITNATLNNLWPQPKRITELSESPWVVPKDVTLSISLGSVPVHQIVDVWNIHKSWLEEAGCNLILDGVHNTNNRSSIVCIVDELSVQSENHYVIVIKEKEVNVICGSLSSLHSALVTFVQLLNLCHPVSGQQGPFEVPAIVICDYPSIPNRGFLLDISLQSRIPTLQHLYHIIDCLLSMKMNQLYMMFRVCQPRSLSPTEKPLTCPLSLSSSELVSLDRYCRDRGISLIPSFEMDTMPNVQANELTDILSHSMTHFPLTRRMHIGPQLSSCLCEMSKRDTNIWTQISPRTVHLMICANVLHDNQDALHRLPIIAGLVEYGFQADYNFSSGCKIALENGRTLSTCPGTAAWTSLSGWPEAGVSNVYSAVLSGIESGSTGLIVAHWGHSASLTPFTFTLPPLVVAAGLSWNHKTHWDFVHSSLGCLIDQHLIKVGGCGVGDAIIELGRCETWLTRMARKQLPTDPTNLPSTTPGSILHQLICEPDAVHLDNLSADHFSTVIKHVRRAVKEKGVHKNSSGPIHLGLGQVASLSKWSLTPLLLMELHLTMDMIITSSRLGRSLVTTGTNPRSNMGIAVVNPGVSNLTPTFRTDLANKVLALQEVYSSVWLHSNQSTGLQSSLLVFSSLLARLLPEQNLGPI